MTAIILRRIASSPMLRLVAYFASLAVAIWVASYWFPPLRELLTLGVPAVPAVDQLRGLEPSVAEDPEGPWMHALFGALALGGSLLFALPVTWTYTVTKRQEGYDQGFVQMLVILPIAVAGVVRVVRGDLALAFALAGIVAAVRFRTTLRDLKNAVFTFVTIGIGLASGTGAWVLAGLLALIFSIVAMTLWRYDIGATKPELVRFAGPVRLSEALVPGEVQHTVAVGNPDLVAPMPPRDLERLSEHARRLAHYVRADALRAKQKYDTLLLVYAADAAAATRTLDQLFGNYAVRWNLIDHFPGRHDTEVLVYLLRLEEAAEVGEFLDRLHCAHGCPMRAAELKPIKGYRQRLT